MVREVGILEKNNSHIHYQHDHHSGSHECPHVNKKILNDTILNVHLSNKTILNEHLKNDTNLDKHK